MVKNKGNAALKNWAIFSGVGIQMGLIIFLGNISGAWMDTKFEKSFLEDTVTIIAVFLAMFTVVYRVNRLNKK